MSSTHFPNGVTNAALNTAMASAPFLDPTLYHTFFDDFDMYLATDWTVTETQAGATQALVAGGNGGQLLLTNSAADDDINAIAYVNKTFVLSVTKGFFLQCRAKLSDVLQSEFLFGLMDTMTAFNPADGVYIYKADGAAPLRLSIEKTSAVTSANSDSVAAGVVNDTFVDVSITYLPDEGVVRGWFNGASFGIIADLTNLPTVALSPAVGVRNGEAVAKTMTVDYLFVAVQR